MLVLGLGLGTVALTLALALEVWPWPKIQGQNLGGLQCSPWTSIDSRELYFKIHIPYLLTVPTLMILLIYVSCQWWVMLLNCACILVRVLEKNRISLLNISS